MPLTFKTINAELAKRWHTARLAKGTGYYYFFGGHAADWLDQNRQSVHGQQLDPGEWLANFDRLKKLNERIMSTGKVPTRKTSRK